MHGSSFIDCTGSRQAKLLDLVRERMRLRHYCTRTEEAYLACARDKLPSPDQSSALVQEAIQRAENATGFLVWGKSNCTKH